LDLGVRDGKKEEKEQKEKKKKGEPTRNLQNKKWTGRRSTYNQVRSNDTFP
jgi:hypothetical protein